MDARLNRNGKEQNLMQPDEVPGQKLNEKNYVRAIENVIPTAVLI
jgi:hypothetical protein